MNRYQELLRDPRWQKKRLQVLQRDEFTCQICFDNTSTLHVHHLGYIKSKMPWEYPDGQLRTLCEDCHKNETDNILLAKRNLSDAFARKGMGENMMQHLADIVDGLDDNFFDIEPKTSILEFMLKDINAWRVVSKMFWDDLHQTMAAGRK